MHRETASEMVSLPWSQNHRKENAAGYVSPLVFYKMPDQGRGTQQLACLVIYSRWLLDLSPQTIPQMCAGLVWVPGYHSFPHNAICFPHKVERKTCFQFLLGLMIVPWEIENNFYARFCGKNKLHCGKHESRRLWSMWKRWISVHWKKHQIKFIKDTCKTG